MYFEVIVIRFHYYYMYTQNLHKTSASYSFTELDIGF